MENHKDISDNINRKSRSIYTFIICFLLVIISSLVFTHQDQQKPAPAVPSTTVEKEIPAVDAKQPEKDKAFVPKNTEPRQQEKKDKVAVPKNTRLQQQKKSITKDKEPLRKELPETNIKNQTAETDIETLEPAEKPVPKIPTSEKDASIKEDNEAADWKLFHETMGDDNGWKLIEDENGVAIYTRKTSASDIKAFRGVTEVEADFNTMVAFLVDGNSYPSYVYLCNKAKILKQKDDSDFYLYSVNVPPWPVKKRDSVAHSRWHRNAETNEVIMECIGVPKLVPEKKGLVRIPLLFVRIVVTPKSKTHVGIIFEGVADPGGLIPDCVSNFCIKQSPRSTLRNIIDKRPFEKYTGKKVSFLETPSP